MKIEILGPGCKRCQQLADNTKAAVQKLGLDAEVVKVEDVQAIVRYGVMATPALVVDGQVRMSGKVIPASHIEALLRQ